MPNDAAPLTGHSTIADWLDHPEGGPALRTLLADGGFGEEVLAPIRNIPLEQLVTLSQGRVDQSVVDDLVRRVNGGALPDASVQAQTDAAAVRDRFSGRTVVVTGAGSGIGRATATRIAHEGGRVVAVDIAGDRLRELASALPAADLRTVTADLSAPGDLDAIVAATDGRVDGLANVAGISDDFSPLHETSDELWRRVFAVNVDGLFRLTRAVLPMMLSAGRGSIVNVASEASLRGNAAGVAYTASKHAVVGITRSSAFMYGPQGIRTNAVAPGGVATGITSGMTQSPFGRERLGPFLALMPPIATPEHLAASITFLLSDDAVNINGVVLPSDGGWSVQ